MARQRSDDPDVNPDEAGRWLEMGRVTGSAA
jgi:hypothetical protein